MCPYKELYPFTVNYFSTNDDEEKAIVLIYQIEDEEIVDEYILNSDDEIYMEKVQQYAFNKGNIKKIKINQKMKLFI